ncbi:hypothetical protein [Streptomyces avicenniae]|uniref:hypothetical protein n=1 Tax=Streptomyces avicenniae TaxID=500153 RepID=UPI000699E027|nr:hypothetical protein [Streptomyces avicenniae]
MSEPDASPQAQFSLATEALAGRVLGALTGTQGPLPPTGPPAAGAPGDVKAYLAAVRVLGPDLYAPALLRGTPPDPADTEAVTEAFRVFPPSPADPPETVRRDRATARLHLGLGGEPLPVPLAPTAAEPGLRPAAGHALPPWRAWSAHLAPLSALALPGADDTLQAEATRHSRALALGTTRALLRRDHPTAARLARWLALTERRGAVPALDTEAVLTHIDLFGGGSVRARLDTAVARLLLVTAPRHRRPDDTGAAGHQERPPA